MANDNEDGRLDERSSDELGVWTKRTDDGTARQHGATFVSSKTRTGPSAVSISIYRAQ